MYCSRCGTEVADQAKFCPSCGLDLASTTPLAAVVERQDATETDLVRDALQNEYEIVQELGRGGMAIVFKAKEKALDREVAVKVLPFSLAFDQEFVERFQREARTAARLEHPHIIPIYRVGKSGRVIYFVMKFLRGKSLSEVIEDRGAIAPREIRKLLIQTAGALGYAHKNGIVHRDIKPDNIMYDESGHAIVTDFGIAKAASGTKLTGTGMSIGTPHYMSPEQARAQSLDGRSDIYSLGVVAYQCLTGQVPFDGEDSFSIGYKHIMEEIPTPPLTSAEVRELFVIIRKMMAKSPDERFQTADDLIAALEGRVPVAPTTTARPASSDAPTTVLPGAKIAAATAGTKGVSTTTPTTPMPRTEPQREAVPAPKKRSGALVGMFFLLLLGGGGAGGYWYFFEGPGAELIGRAGPGVSPVDPPPDTTLIATGDSTVADSAATTDSAAAVDSVPPRPISDLPNFGWIAMGGAVPRTGTIKVNGDAREPGLMRVAPGSHLVEVTARGFEPFSQRVTVGRGDTVLVTVRMRALTAERPPQRQPDRRFDPVDYCAQPGPDYNKDDSCYDTPPSLQRAPLIPIPDGVSEMPTPAVLWVHVGPQGQVLGVAPAQASSEARFTIAASRFAAQAAYTPARKGTQAVEAWFRLTVRARPR